MGAFKSRSTAVWMRLSAHPLVPADMMANECFKAVLKIRYIILQANGCVTHLRAIFGELDDTCVYDKLQVRQEDSVRTLGNSTGIRNLVPIFSLPIPALGNWNLKESESPTKSAHSRCVVHQSKGQKGREHCTHLCSQTGCSGMFNMSYLLGTAIPKGGVTVVWYRHNWTT